MRGLTEEAGVLDRSPIALSPQLRTLNRLRDESPCVYMGAPKSNLIYVERSLTLADFTLPTDCAVSVFDAGDGELVLSQVNEATGKAESVALSVRDLQSILDTYAAMRTMTEAKNTDRRLVPA